MPADLNPRFVDGNVQEGADDVHVGAEADVQGGRGDSCLLEETLQLLRPAGHILTTGIVTEEECHFVLYENIVMIRI